MTGIRSKFLSRTDAAQRVRELHGIPCEPSTLAKRATTGTGPTYRIIGGKAMYLDADVDSWARSLVSEPLGRLLMPPLSRQISPSRGVWADVCKLESHGLCQRSGR